jgi:hypothetical protein
MLRSLWRGISARYSRKVRPIQTRRQRERRLWLERLEERTVPTTVFIQSGLSGALGATVAVPINIDTLSDTTNGNSGLSAATLAVQYDPNVFTVSNSDISPGSLVPAGWTLTPTVDQTNGTITINLAGSADTATVGGTLATIDFHINTTAALGATTINLMQNVGTSFTSLTDQNSSSYTLTPPPTNAANDTADAAFTVNQDQPPTAGNDTFSVTANNTLSVGTPGILGNDTDPQGLQLTAVNFVGPQHGSATFNANGSFLYTPTPGYVGPDSFTYQANNGVFNSNIASVTINVTAKLSIPTTLTGPAGGTVNVPVNIDNPSLAGGLTSATLAIDYDPTVFNVSTSDITLGAVPSAGTGWTISSTVDATAGQIGITLSSTTPITSTTGGSLVNIAFHVNSDAISQMTAINLAAGNSPNGTSFTTSLTGSTGNVPPQPAPTNASNDSGIDGLVTITGVNRAPTILGPTAATTNENGSLTFAGTTLISVNDVDSEGGQEQVSLAVNHGTITLSSTAGLTINGGANNSSSVMFTGTLADLNAALAGLVYTPSVNFFGADSLGVTINDLGNTGTGGAQSDGQIVALTVNQVATHLQVSAPATATAGTAFTVTVTALDAGNATVTGYTGTVQITSSDGKAVLPATATLPHGSGSFTVTLGSVGSETVTATDMSNSALTASSNITVNPGAATHFVVTGPSSAVARTALTFTVTAEDSLGNTATGHTGTVHFVSSDGAATLPPDATLTAGAGSFSVTFNTRGSQTLVVTDAANSSVVGVSGTVTVSEPAYTVGVFNSTSGVWTLDTQGTADPSPANDTFTFGGVGDTAITGDWNGAGFDEIGVYRVDSTMIDPASGLHPLMFSLDVNGNGQWDPSGGDQSFYFGVQGDTVVIGDWDGDGKDEIGVVRAGSDGTLVWSIDMTGDHTNYVVYHFGMNGDEPIAGVWSGNGKTEIGTVRTVGGGLVWSLDFNGDGVWSTSDDRQFQFGNAGDVPILGNWTGGTSTLIGVQRPDPSGSGLQFSLDLAGNGVYSVPPDKVATFGQTGDTSFVGDWSGGGATQIGSYRLSADAHNFLFSLDKNGDGVQDAGDVLSQTGLPGGMSGQVCCGQWKPAV